MDNASFLSTNAGVEALVSLELGRSPASAPLPLDPVAGNTQMKAQMLLEEVMP